MAFFPILIEMRGTPCLVAGGGTLALHKARLLLEQGAEVTVVAPEICPELRALAVSCIVREVTAQDAAGKCLVIDATGDAEVQAVLSEVCRAAHIPYNCAGDGAACTAIFPAIHQRERLLLAVSTLGASPAACVRLRDALAERLPPDTDAVLLQMEELRAAAKARFLQQPVRSRFLHRCLDIMLEQQAPLTDGQIKAICSEYDEEPEEKEKRPL